MERSFIERYATGAMSLAPAIAGLGKNELTAHPVPGTWSIQQIVFHVMESDLIATDRMKRIAAMDNPLLIGFDETAFGERLFHEELDIRLACELFEKNRLLTGDLLRRLPDEAFSRTGVHNERGRISLQELVIGTADHLEHHLKFIRQKRELLGKPVA
jgi:hypothetical protein